jgi:hypothetical protein
MTVPSQQQQQQSSSSTTNNAAAGVMNRQVAMSDQDKAAVCIQDCCQCFSPTPTIILTPKHFSISISFLTLCFVG